VAVTVNVYAVPVVRPVTTSGEDAPVAVKPPGEDVAVYVNDVGYPAFAGAVKATLTDVPLATVAVPIVGALGVVGQAPAGPIACICCLDVQRPEKLGITSSLYLLMGIDGLCRAK
jgi:hypothetical protein